MDNTERLLLRPEEAADLLGVSRAQAYRLIAAGELPYVRLGHRIRVPVEALRRVIEEKIAAIAT